jgi:hypothetical protein
MIKSHKICLEDTHVKGFFHVDQKEKFSEKYAK